MTDPASRRKLSCQGRKTANNLIIPYAAVSELRRLPSVPLRAFEFDAETALDERQRRDDDRSPVEANTTSGTAEVFRLIGEAARGSLSGSDPRPLCLKRTRKSGCPARLSP